MARSLAQRFRAHRRNMGCIAFAFGIALFAACNSSPSATPSAETPGVVLPPLAGVAASNEVQLLERLRRLPAKAPFERRAFTSQKASSSELKYLLFKPRGIQPGKTYPLVLSLHGGAPRRHFDDLVQPYLPGLAYGLGRFISDDTQTNHPCFVFAPWSDTRSWDERNIALVLETLDVLQREFPIDSNRVYVTGQSMGGFGTWSMVTEHPERFAAAVPICGGGEPRSAPRAKGIPIWAFHGSADGVVPVEYTRQMISALLKAGAKPIYWEYQGADHAATAERAYCERALIDWLFAQSRTNRTVIPPPFPQSSTNVNR